MQRYAKGIEAHEIRKLVGPAPTILEIGSHDGSDTVKFLEAIPNARIFCFEPDQRPIARFKEKLGNDPRVTLCEKAVADVDGEKLFYASTGRVGRREDWDYSGSLCKPTGHLTRSPEIKFKEPTLVPCIKLDTWRASQASIGHVDFIWADVQGSQHLLLDGGNRVVCQTRYLYIESHNPVAYAGEPTQEELITRISYCAFWPVATYAENILFRNNYRA